MAGGSFSLVFSFACQIPLHVKMAVNNKIDALQTTAVSTSRRWPVDGKQQSCRGLSLLYEILTGSELPKHLEIYCLYCQTR
jgi:hypothetical protein